MSTSVRQEGPAPELVSAARDGDPRALDALVSASLPLVYNLVGRALRGHADVDDVVQETMLRVVRGIGDLERPEAYRSWLVAIALRQARDQGTRQSTARARTMRHDQSGREYADRNADFTAVTVLRLGLTEQRRDVAEATRWLDPEDRELLSLWWLEESGHLGRPELADALGLSAPHAAVRVHRMKQQLDTARSVVRALRDIDRCGSLREVAESWDGTPSPLWRKRFARHVRDCRVCSARDRALVPVASLLRGLPLVPVPAALAAMAAHGGGGGLSATQPAKAATRGGRRARPRNSGAKAVASSHPVLITSVAVVAVAVAAYAVIPSAHPATTPSAGTQQAAGISLTTPSPSADAADTATPSASPDASASPSTSTATAARTSAAAVVPAASAKTSSRKGVAVWTFNGQDQALAESGASWFYTWSSSAEGVSAPKAGFVPMIWGSSSVTAGTLAQAKQSTSCGCVLGFNEPDNSGQSNMTPAQALALWPQLQSTGLELGSPAVAAGAADSGGWLDQFMAGAEQDGYRVDFITLHWYGSDFDPSAAAGQLQSYIEAVYAKYHLPIWLTEFALISFAGGEQYPSESVQAEFLTDATAMLDKLSYVKRYAWFGLPATSALPNTGLFQTGPVVTPVGKAFEAAE